LSSWVVDQIWVSPHRIYSEVGINSRSITCAELPSLKPAGLGSERGPGTANLVVNDCGYFDIRSGISFAPTALRYEIPLVGEGTTVQRAVVDSDYIYWTASSSIGKAPLP
jgi:hypothetical protein